MKIKTIEEAIIEIENIKKLIKENVVCECYDEYGNKRKDICWRCKILYNK